MQLLQFFVYRNLPQNFDIWTQFQAFKNWSESLDLKFILKNFSSLGKQ